jgi:hypothetical protein
MVRRLNIKCLESVVATVVESDESSAPGAISRHARLWRQMTPETCRQVAGCPVFLMDLHFLDSAWWQWIVHQGPKPLRSATPEVRWPIRDAEVLVREILMQACIIAHKAPEAAKLSFGMSPLAFKAIENLTALEAEALAAGHAEDLQLRWTDNAIFWKNLLEAALSGSEEAVGVVHMHCLQLRGSD